MRDVVPPGGVTMADTVARMRQIASEAQDHLLLADGPPHPDGKLLEVCAEALALLSGAERAREQRPMGRVSMDKWTAAMHAFDRQMMEEAAALDYRASPWLRRAAKVPATTAAGIFAKALVVRASATGAAALARTLAADLVDCRGLRGSLWPADSLVGEAD